MSSEISLHNLTKNWAENFQKPIIIAGPCSAESEKQMLETASRIKNSDEKNRVQIFRAGIWKPRTKPNGFEGVGEIGLKWLKKVKDEFGFLTATEVANANHVKSALQNDVDVLWIGARSTVNPFTVQEIAETLKDTDKIVLVKNPVNPDLNLWIGALERLANQNIKNLGIIHRGFSTYKKTKYRNTPNWPLALEFKELFPNIPIFIDPSHISGRRDLLQEVAQDGLNVGYDGVMIETHCNPDEAWSDAKQQITPEKLFEILNNLKIRENISAQDEKLEQNRTMISDIDQQLIELLSERMKISENIGLMKKEKNLVVFQPERWKSVKNLAEKKAEESNISTDFIQQIFNLLHEESIKVQNRVMFSENDKL